MATTEAEIAQVGGVLAVIRGVARRLLHVPRGWSWLLPLAWMALIWALSSHEIPFRTGHSEAWAFLGNAAHAPEFGFLALLLILVAPRRDGWAVLGTRECLLIFSLVVLYGWLDELHQSHVPGRAASILDVATDAVGAASVLWIAGYAGSERAVEGGLLARLLIALLACAAAAFVSTAYGLLWL